MREWADRGARRSTENSPAGRYPELLSVTRTKAITSIHAMQIDRQGRTSLKGQFQIVHNLLLGRSVEALAATDGHVGEEVKYEIRKQ